MTHTHPLSNCSKAQYARWAKERPLTLPAKPDQDVIRIAAYFKTTYAKAKALKALSYGLAVDEAILDWCLDHTDKGRVVSNILGEIRRFKGVPIETIHGAGQYIIRDAGCLALLRKIMEVGA